MTTGEDWCLVEDSVEHVTAAGGDSSLLAGLDGVDKWTGLTGASSDPARVQMLYNIDPVHGDRNLNGPGGAIR